MAIHIEVQDNDTLKQVRARETQFENMEKLNNIGEAVDNINLDSIETTTNEIKDIVVDNLEEQADLDELLDSMKKLTKSISEMKKKQTTLIKKVNNLQKTIDDLVGDKND